MQDKPAIYVVGIECVPGFEEKFNQWYEETHIAMLLKSNLLDKVTRYKVTPDHAGEYPKYLAIFEFKSRKAFEAWYTSPERRAAHDEIMQSGMDKTYQRKWTVSYEAIKTLQR